MLRVDSRKVEKNDSFIALRGINTDGHDYILKAIENGAKTIICEEGTYNVETIIVPDTRKYLAEYLKLKVNLDNIILIGITGTNGKTTSAYLTYQLLNLLGLKTAYIGTIGFYIENKVRDLNNTTPDLLELYEMFEECINNDVKVVAMEVSSHSLAMERVLGIEFDFGVFTNLTRDHLDYHKTMEDYKKSKQRLFNKLKNNKFAIINSDDENYEYFIFENNNNITYGLNGDFKLSDYELDIDKSVFNINDNRIKLNIPGKYNIYNYMIAFIIAYKLEFDISDIILKTEYLKPPKGRFDMIRNNSNIIVIDYAHTPDAVYNILKSTEEYKKNKVITIIGCGGNRDRTKRSMMGKISTDNSDYVIFTNDNPRFDDENEIINDIILNLDNTNYEVILNREDAIFKGISLLEEDDILLILGKGHEDYQTIKGIKYHFDDKEVVYKKLLNQ